MSLYERGTGPEIAAAVLPGFSFGLQVSSGMFHPKKEKAGQRPALLGATAKVL